MSQHWNYSTKYSFNVNLVIFLLWMQNLCICFPNLLCKLSFITVQKKSNYHIGVAAVAFQYSFFMYSFKSPRKSKHVLVFISMISYPFSGFLVVEKFLNFREPIRFPKNTWKVGRRSRNLPYFVVNLNWLPRLQLSSNNFSSMGGSSFDYI